MDVDQPLTPNAELEAQLDAAQSDIQVLSADLRAAKEVIADLELTTQSLQNRVAQRRYRLVDAAMGVVAKCAPPHSVRRGVLRTGFKVTQAFYQSARSIKSDRQFRRDVVVFSEAAKASKGVLLFHTVPWEADLYQRPQHQAVQLARLGYCIGYMDYCEANIRCDEVQPNLFVLGARWMEEIKNLSDLDRYFILYSTSHFPGLHDLLAMKAAGVKFVYDFIDDFDESISGDVSEQLKVFRHLDRLAPEVAMASAHQLLERLTEQLPDHPHVLLSQNAANIEDFSEDRVGPVPEDMKSIVQAGKPIVGYYGALAPWLDYDLINHVTRSLPEYNFVFLGIDYGDSVHRLERRANVHWLGGKKYHDLVHYSSRFDCATIPFALGDIAKHTSPVKLFEYMATGLPTVCTRDLKECEGYEYVYMSDDRQQFVENVKKAVQAKARNGVRDVLVAQAEANTWAKRIADLDAALTQVRR